MDPIRSMHNDHIDIRYRQLHKNNFSVIFREHSPPLPVEFLFSRQALPDKRKKLCLKLGKEQNVKNESIYSLKILLIYNLNLHLKHKKI